MSTASVGQRAESLVVTYLEERGFKIIEHNWKTRWCEIDIVAVKNDVTYFVEVKYRSSDAWGDGLSYITSVKLKQMLFAANLYADTHNLQDYCLAVAAVDRQGVTAFEVLENEYEPQYSIPK